MRCEDALTLLSARLDREVTPEEAAAVEAHLAGCPECRATADALSRQDAELRLAFASRRTAAAATAAAVAEAVRSETVPAATPRVLPRFARPLLALAAAVALLTAGYLIRGTSRTDAPVPLASGPAASVAVAPEVTKPAASTSVPTGPEMLVAKPRPEPKVETLPEKGAVATAANERRRLALPDGSVLYVNENTALTVPGDRQVVLERGEVFVEVSPRPAGSTGATFEVKTPRRTVAALGTKFAVRADAAGTGVVVTQGKVKVSGTDDVVAAGQVLPADAAAPRPAPRASHLLDWTRELVLAAESPLVPASKFRGGALTTLDPDGQDVQLPLRRMHIDVHVEDGFARTTIDQTFFNETYAQLEGTFHFPLPADASLSRLAMYVDGRLTEGGMAERDHARQVYETIRYQRRDPALLEWVDGSTFKMRVFPLEPRQEKRIVLSYSQRVESLYGALTYRFPAGHTARSVGEWSFHARIKGGSGWSWQSASHVLTPAADGEDLLLDTRAAGVAPTADVVLRLTDPAASAAGTPRFSASVHEGRQYLMLRYRPQLDSPPRKQRRDWIFLVETSADRDPLLARTQIEVVRTLLQNAEHDDTFAVVAAGTRARRITPARLPATPDRIDAVLEELARVQLIGALDLGRGLEAAADLADGVEAPCLVHVGSGVSALGERRPDVLAKSVPARLPYVGVGVGKRWARGFMKQSAERTGGVFTQINPDEGVRWRAFELSAALNTPRLQAVQVVDNDERARFLVDNPQVAQGEELAAVARVDGTDPVALPKSVTVRGLLDGRPFAEVVPVAEVRAKADYLPRTWAKLEIDRLLAEDASKNRDAVVALSKAMYVMSPFTSLLVLENEEMYKRFKVDRGRKDHWALYPCPPTIDVGRETIGARPAAFVKKTAGQPRTEAELRATICPRLSPDGPPNSGVVDANVATDGRAWQLLHLWNLNGRAIPAYAFSPDGRQFATAGDPSGLPVTSHAARPALPIAGTGTTDLTVRPWNGPVPLLRFDQGSLTGAPSAFGGNIAGGFGGTGMAGFGGANFFRNGVVPGGFGGILGGGTPAPVITGPTVRIWDPKSGTATPPAPAVPATVTPVATPTKVPLMTALDPKPEPMPAPPAEPGSDGRAEEAFVSVPRATLTAEVLKGLVYVRPTAGTGREFDDLTAHAPGLSAREADYRAVLEAEGRPAPRGKIDPAAAALIDRARSAGWEKVTLPTASGRPSEVVCDGSGKCRYVRTLPLGLQEVVACDGVTRREVYADLGLAARRAVTRFLRAELVELVPWLVLPADDLAAGADVLAEGENIVRVVPLATSDAPRTAVELSFADGRLIGRRWLEMPAGKEIARESYGEDGTVRRLDPAGKVLSEAKYGRSAATAPADEPAAKELVVVEMPARTPEHVIETRKLNEKEQARWSDADALALLVAHLHGEPAKAWGVYDVHFRTRKQDWRVGLQVLLASAGQPYPEALRTLADRSPAAAYLAWRAGVADLTKVPVDTFAGRLARCRDLVERLTFGGRKGAATPALAFAREYAGTVHGWAVLAAVGARAEWEPEAPRPSADLWLAFAGLPGLEYAARYESARSLLRAEKSAEAAARFAELYRSAIDAGSVPPVDADFRSALRTGGAGETAWKPFVRDMAARLFGQHRRPTAVLLAWQCQHLGDGDLGDEILTATLDGASADERPAVGLAVAECLRQRGLFSRAEKVVTELLAGPAGRSADVWYLAAELAARRRAAARQLECLERATALEFDRLPETIDLTTVRGVYSLLLAGYATLLEQHGATGTEPPADLAARVVRAADRWRALDPDNSTVCVRAGTLLDSLGEAELAWDYRTTPIALRPNEAAPLAELAANLTEEGRLEEADRLYAMAFESESTNAQILWDRAQLLEHAGRDSEAADLYRRLAAGDWQDRFLPLRDQARGRLGLNPLPTPTPVAPPTPAVPAPADPASVPQTPPPPPVP